MNDPWAGKTLGKYKIIELLGRGGMGAVYRATDTQTGEPVAVKALNPDVVTHDPDLVERFVREGEALRQLNHPNIVRMVAVVQEQGRHYLVIEYVPGGSLETLLATEGRLPSRRVIEIALEVADALTRAHHLGIIHRDLKPANVLLAEDGTPRLADFGIAHIGSRPRLTQTGILMGTVDYLSPEVCQGEPPDERADIWAFGVLLFEMLTGRLPFEGNNLTAKLTAILTQPIPDLPQFAPDVPDALADLIYRMLEKDRQQRIPSVRLVGAELEAMLKGWQVITPFQAAVAKQAARDLPIPTLHIELLGDFRLTHGDAPLTTIVHARQQALLAYLVLHRDAPQPRQHLAFLFWPDTSEAQALTNLRNLLHKLRQALPEPERFLLADTQTVQWRQDAPYTLDVADLQAALAQAATRANLELAVDLYRGDLLPSCYDDWISPERERLRQTFIDALERLTAALEQERDYAAAIRYAQRLLQHDRLREETYRLLMRLHAVNNDRASALRIYHTCVTTLQNELAADPSPATHELYRSIFSTEAVSPTPAIAAPNQPPLVGRHDEWNALQAAWQIAASGKPYCAILTGEAGIGKTRLAEELSNWANRQGVVVAVARCYAAEGALAYAPVIAWLRSPAIHPRLLTLETVWLTEVARLLPELLTECPDLPHPSPVTEGAQRQRLFDALARALLKGPVPLMLLMDDLQWCDRDTLEWLHYVLHFDPGARLLVVGTVRAGQVAVVPNDDHPLTALTSALHRDGQLIELELGPLDADETASLAAHMAERALTSEQAARLFQETEGNPLFVVETVRFGLPAKDTTWVMGNKRAPQSPFVTQPAALPPKVHAVLQSRLSQLSPNARALAGLAAAIGREFTFPVLARASDQDEDALVRSLDELWQRRIVRDAPGRGTAAYDFTHDKLREVAYNSQSAARRRLLHQRIAQAMESVHEPALDSVSGQIATHYELAGRLEQAIPYYERAAGVAQQVYANADAIRYYRRAIALLAGPTSYPPPHAASLHEHLGDVLHWTGQYEEARTVLQQAVIAVPHLESIHRAQLFRKIGNTWRDQYRYQEALQAYADAERVLGQAPLEPSPEWWQAWIQVLFEMDSVYYWLGQVQESDKLRLKLQPAVEQHGAPSQRAVYFLSMSRIEFRRNRCVATAEMVSWSKAALAAQQEAGNQADIPSTQFMVGFSLLWHGEPQTAIELLQTALHLAEQTGDVSLQARCLTYSTIAYRQCTQVEETRQYATRSLEVATLAHMPEYIAMAKANQAWLAWRAGDLGLAQELGQVALELWHQLPSGHASAPFQWLARWPLIAAALQKEQLAPAIDYARALLDPGQQRVPDALAASLEQAIQAWDGGASESARELLHQSLALAQQMRYL